MVKRLNKIVLGVLFACLTSSVANAVGQRHLVPVAPDSSNFIRASVMFFSPLNEYRSSVGHIALHMECPSEGLDLIFGKGEPDDVFRWEQLFGMLTMKMLRHETADMLQQCKVDGRMVTECELNLTHHEKQRLWMLLDKAVTAEENNFCIESDQCAAEVLSILQQCTIDEYIDTEVAPAPLTLPLGEYLEWSVKESKWYYFVAAIMSGNRFNSIISAENFVSPELLIPMLQHSVLRQSAEDTDSIAARPLFKGKPRQILPMVTKTTHSPVTPLMVFTALFIISILVTLAEWCFNMHSAAHWFDRMLFILYALWSLMIVWLAIAGVTFANASWNWCVIPFNPAPIVIWLLYRHRTGYYKVFLCYAAVLILFVLATLLFTITDVSMALIASALLVRCCSTYMKKKSKK